MNDSRSASGQILVLVLLVVLVGLTIGLSIASRTLTNIKNTSDLSQSNQAYSAAEAGVEKALAQLKNDSHACDAPSNCSLTTSDLPGGFTGSTVNVVQVGNQSGVGFGIPNLAQDDDIQLNLDTYSGGTVTLYWGSGTPNCYNSNVSSDSCPAVVVSVVYVTSGGQYGLGKATYDPHASDHGNGFTPADQVTNSGMGDNPAIQTGSTGTNYYRFKETVTLTPGGSGSLVPSSATAKLMRVRFMYHGTQPVAFVPPSGVSLPQQGQQITSTATVGTKQRTVKVFKSNATLPAIFDYALFNGSTSQLQK